MYSDVMSERVAWTPSTEVNCAKLLTGNEEEQDRVFSRRRRHPTSPLRNAYYINATKNCSSFIKERHYVTSASDVERNFPLAFSLMMHKDVDMVERLLRMIYRPHNFYCVHVDIKAAPEVRLAMEGIAGCLPNVFISSRSLDVQWSKFTMVEADLVCMEDLLDYSWKYGLDLKARLLLLRATVTTLASAPVQPCGLRCHCVILRCLQGWLR